jgi:hypothetical protein
MVTAAITGVKTADKRYVTLCVLQFVSREANSVTLTVLSYFVSSVIYRILKALE